MAHFSAHELQISPCLQGRRMQLAGAEAQIPQSIDDARRFIVEERSEELLPIDEVRPARREEATGTHPSCET